MKMVPTTMWDVNDSYRKAALLIANAARERRYNTILISSARKGEGKTTATLNVARALRDGYGLRSLVVELDRSGTSVSSLLGLNGTGGLAAIATGGLARDCLHQNGTGFAVIPAGADLGTRDPAEALRRIVNDLGTEFDFILVDAPALLGQTHTLEAGTVIPRLILVVEAGRTPIETIDHVKHLLSAHGIAIVGTVLNKQRRHIPNWINRWLTKA